MATLGTGTQPTSMTVGTDRIRREHQVIADMLDAAAALAERVAQGREVDGPVLDGVWDFFHRFVERNHNAKEVEVLYPRLARKGVSLAGLPLARIEEEHARMAEILEAVADATDGMGAKVPGAEKEWVRQVLHMVQVVRAHELKEDAMLVAAAERLFTPEEQAELAQAFEHWEAKRVPEGIKSHLERCVHTLPMAALGRRAATHLFTP
ncbi:MAG: hemerythrin domain-containing protein [Myxococcales bacterium]|nr:hemerythrin domain-containing protein [Myxococcales bacterium]